ncbi:MAG: hypothetical protein JSS16_00380 [Proteobacteria bacterium]|jgi:hypothetical protein|nr:hypothetical protein [Pseudomonadota bacterium]
MDKKILAVVAAVTGLVIGVAGARVFVPAATTTVCPVADNAAEAKADAIARQLHAHDHDAYVPHPVPPIGELPKPTQSDPPNTAAH